MIYDLIWGGGGGWGRSNGFIHHEFWGIIIIIIIILECLFPMCFSLLPHSSVYLYINQLVWSQHHVKECADNQIFPFITLIIIHSSV